MSSFSIASILGDETNSPKRSQVLKLQRALPSPPPTPQQENLPWSLSLPSTSSVQQDWLSYPPPSTIQLLPTLPLTPPQTPQQWVGSTPSRPRYSPYPRQPQLSKPGKIPGVARFASPLSKEELEKKCQRFVPSNTQRNNTWATNVFAEWLSERNKQTIEQYPDILQSQQPTSTVDVVLAAFILEARRKDGDCYPANTLKNILAAIYRIMKAKYGATNVINFMEKESRERSYPHLHNAMDHQFRLLRCNGIGVERKQAEVITVEQEKQMWERDVLGTYTPKVLLQTVFFYNGKNFCLRGLLEHQTLRFSQLVRLYNPDRYTYYEFGSKNHPGGVNDKSQGKCVTIVHTGNCKSHVALLDLYLNKVPKANIETDSPFYLSPLPFTPLRQRPWYFTDPLPTKTLKFLLKSMCSDAGLKGNFTNHSLRATGATTLFDAGVPEAIIQKRTGHKSVDSLRFYERTTLKQNMEVSSLLNQATATLPDTEIEENFTLSPEEFDMFKAMDDSDLF